MSFTFSPAHSELVTNPIKLRPYIDALEVAFGHPARIVAMLGIGSFAKGEAVLSKLKIVKERGLNRTGNLLERIPCKLSV